MESIATSLCSTDVFLVNTANTQTGYISAIDLNYISYQFPKILNEIRSANVITPEIKTTTLSASNIKILGTNTTSITGNFNTFIIKSGLIISAYNTYTSEITGISATIDNKLSALSSDVFNVFFDSGTARLPQFIHEYGYGVSQIVLTGSKLIPPGLVIKSTDITYNVYYPGNIPGTFVQTTTATNIIFIKDFDYDFLNYLEYGSDDFGDMYQQNGLNGALVNIPFIIVNYATYPPNASPLITWKVQKIY